MASGPIISLQICGKKGNSGRFYFLGPKITMDIDCRHEIKICLLPERKTMANLNSVLTSKDISFLTKVCLYAMVFLVVMQGYESLTIQKAEGQRIDAFKLQCWRRLLRVPWKARRSKWSILKEINPDYSLEGLMLKLKLHYLTTDAKSQLIGKDPVPGKH